MSATDCRTLHIYRLPVYQKRITGIDNYIVDRHVRSPSPVFTSKRRHSTPPVPTKRFIDINSPPSKKIIKNYHHHTRAICANKEQKSPSAPIKSPPRPISLIKERHQDERATRTVTTPTSVQSFTDIILPKARRNRNVFVETPSSIASESQSISRNTSTTKRGRLASLIDVENDGFQSDDDSHDKSIRDDTFKSKIIKWCHDKCPCRLSNCNFCHWYCSCSFCCWIICFVLAIGLFIGIIISFRLLSN